MIVALFTLRSTRKYPRYDLLTAELERPIHSLSEIVAGIGEGRARADDQD
jgi:hypothetical protein